MSTEPIHFIGAGPGSPDLLTLRGRNLIAAADLVLYAGSLVPEGVLVHAREGADIR
ncbi:MAG: SAM-dependent methyltransferase, partial [Pseudomonadota bacterium]|nr:SAM-dependent methyltransferase [Pseudomonadota bacterium]